MPPSPGYVPVAAPSKPPRPRVLVGALLVIGGTVLSFVGVLLPWLSANGVTANGLDDFIYEDSSYDLRIVESPGTSIMFGALVLLALGITLLAAGRVLAVAIISIVASAIGVFFGAVMVGIVSDTKDFIGDGSLGIGVLLQPVGPLVALAGSITATAKRRR